MHAVPAQEAQSQDGLLVSREAVMDVYVTSAGTGCDDPENEQSAHFSYDGAEEAHRRRWRGAADADFTQYSPHEWVAYAKDARHSPNVFIIHRYEVEE
jgi:hypothetical protein